MTFQRLVVGVAACACIAATAAVAFAGEHRRFPEVFHLVSHPGLAVVPTGAAIMNDTSDGAAFTTGAGTVTCTGVTFDLTAGLSWNSPHVDSTVDRLTLSSCSDTLPSVAFASCRTVAPTTITLGRFAQWHRPSLRCANTSGACYYGATQLLGSPGSDNVAATLRFTTQSITHTVPAGASDDLGSGACGTGGALSTTATRLRYLATGAFVTVNEG
jgi:hypothetical protein